VIGCAFNSRISKHAWLCFTIFTQFVRQYLDKTALNVKRGEGGEGMSDQKDDLGQSSVEQGNEDPASGSDEQLGSGEALGQQKKEEKDQGITESLDSKWLSDEEEKAVESKSTTTDLPENKEEDVEVATGDHELKVLPDNEDEEKEEILLADTKTIRSKKQPSKTSQQKNEMEEQTILLTSVSKQLEKQNTQINKILQMLQSVVKQVNRKTTKTCKTDSIANKTGTKTSFTNSKGTNKEQEENEKITI
jgi:hypothetical protein